VDQILNTTATAEADEPPSEEDKPPGEEDDSTQYAVDLRKKVGTVINRTALRSGFPYWKVTNMVKDDAGVDESLKLQGCTTDQLEILLRKALALETELLG
jgi:hypothetical protein